jgi:heptosyltransferase I
MTQERILIIRLSALGDVVHTLAFVNRLRKAKPHAHITWILQPLTYDLVKHQDNVDRFVVFDRKGGFGAYRKLYHELKGDAFDLVFMLQVSLKASFISLCAKGRVKLGFDIGRSRELQWLFSNRRIPRKKPGHVLAQFFEFLDCLGLPDTPLDWGIRFTEAELAYKDEFFKTIPRDVVSFVVASSKPEKDWAVEGYAKVMDMVDERLDLQPMIVGGPSAYERELAERITGMCRCTPVLALEKPVRHTLLQLAGSKAVVAPDTGPMHMAVALNVPTVALYGYSDPRRCGPYVRFQDLLIDAYNRPGEEKEKITRKTKEGRMADITADEVFEKIQRALKAVSAL